MMKRRSIKAGCPVSSGWLQIFSGGAGVCASASAPIKAPASSKTAAGLWASHLLHSSCRSYHTRSPGRAVYSGLVTMLLGMGAGMPANLPSLVSTRSTI